MAHRNASARCWFTSSNAMTMFLIASTACLASNVSPRTAPSFYLFPKATALIESLEGVSDDLQLADYLIQKAEVAVVPGSAFGLAGYFRVSIATSMEELETAMDRIEKAISCTD